MFRNWILSAVVGLGGFCLATGEADAQWGRHGGQHGGHHSNHHSGHHSSNHRGVHHGGHFGGAIVAPGYSSFHSGGFPLGGLGYSSGYQVRRPVYHDTTHLDYHGPSLQRHGNHYDFVPGHYDVHRSGHFDY